MTVLNADGTVRGGGGGAVSASGYNWQYLHQGGRYDAVSGLYSFRHRDYSPTLQRWLQQDPMGYVDGASLYTAYFVPHGVDPYGTYWHDVKKTKIETQWVHKTQQKTKYEKQGNCCYLAIYREEWDEREVIEIEDHTFGYYGQSVMETGGVVAAVGAAVLVAGIGDDITIIGIADDPVVVPAGTAVAGAGGVIATTGGLIYAGDWLASRWWKPDDYTKTSTRHEIVNQKTVLEERIKIPC